MSDISTLWCKPPCKFGDGHPNSFWACNEQVCVACPCQTGWLLGVGWLIIDHQDVLTTVKHTPKSASLAWTCKTYSALQNHWSLHSPYILFHCRYKLWRIKFGFFSTDLHSLHYTFKVKFKLYIKTIKNKLEKYLHCISIQSPCQKYMLASITDINIWFKLTLPLATLIYHVKTNL